MTDKQIKNLNIEDALAFVQRHTNTEYVITGKPRREEIPDYPETALRETIVNAVCHRDYFERRCFVVVEVFADRVEIYNPGGLPSGLDPKKFGTKSVPRNLLVADMLHRANYIERAGTGISRIKQAIAKHKKKVLLDIQYDKNSIFYSVIFRKKGLVDTTQKNLTNTTQKQSVDTTQKNLTNTTQKRSVDTTQKNLANTTQKILNLINKTPYISRQKLSEQIGDISPDGIKYHLEQLKKQGFIKRVGPAKGGYWKVLKKG